MSTCIVGVVDTREGRLRGVVERIADRQELPFADQSQLLAVLSGDAGAPSAADAAQERS